MEILQLLGVAVGLASLAGLNLYLTVFLTGLSVRFDWIALAPEYERLGVLGDPWILGVAGFLFAMEFLADKFPWVDSAWDAVHTAIRPVGAALLGIMVLGDSNPVFNVIVGLLGAWLGLTTHALKASVRLQANASPEPISNIALSLAEDATVVLGLGLVFAYPVVSLVVAVIFLAAIWYFIPRMLRSTWIKLWLCGRKLRLAAEDKTITELPAELPVAAIDVIGSGAKISWSAPCISGAGPGYSRNRFGWLAAFDDGKFCFVPKRHPRRLQTLPVGSPTPNLERKFLADVLTLQWADGTKAGFLFDRGSRALAEAITVKMGGVVS